MAEQPEGSYPRLNYELLGKEKYDDMIVSMVGKFDTTRTDASVPLLYTNFITCDNQSIELVADYASALPAEIMAVAKDMVFELIGQVQQSNKLAVFVVRPLSIDMDLQVYNQMLMKVQHNQKFVKDYFPSSFAGDVSGAGMITG